MCDNPIYDHNNEIEANLPCYPEKVGIDLHRTLDD